MMNRFLVLLAMVFISALCPVDASTGTELIISIPNQTVVLVDGGNLIALYERVHIGMHVTVSKKPIGELVPLEKPTLLSRAD
jgi:hypothetical protein